MPREYELNPVIDALGILPRGDKCPAWGIVVVKHPSGKKRVAVGVREPGLLTKTQALELASQLIQIASVLGPEADELTSHQPASLVGLSRSNKL